MIESKIDMNIKREFYYPICNTSEIDRIIDVKNAKDYLLKLRADTIVDHMRLFRVYRNKALTKGHAWSLEKSFTNSHFTNFIAKLPCSEAKKCENITYGNIFSNYPNGMICNSKYGIISTVSESLCHFLEYMNLSFLEFNNDVPTKVRLNAARIALRVMFQTEALDFYMDPRGIIPIEIHSKINSLIPYQMQFIAGHELSHYLLGHLSEKNTSEQYLLRSLFNSQENYKPLNVYNQSQSDEFAADLAAIMLPNYDQLEINKMTEAALLWFAYLDLFQGVNDSINPPVPTWKQTHPQPRDRYFNILNNSASKSLFDNDKWRLHIHKNVDKLKDMFIQEACTNIELYENYGSLYLDEANTFWRGKALIDRVDYY